MGVGLFYREQPLAPICILECCTFLRKPRLGCGQDMKLLDTGVVGRLAGLCNVGTNQPTNSLCTKYCNGRTSIIK